MQEAPTEVALRWRRLESAYPEALDVSVGTMTSQTHLALRRLREASPELAELIGEDHR